MRRGFLLRSPGPVIDPPAPAPVRALDVSRSPPDGERHCTPSSPSPVDPLTRIVSTHPYIVCSDVRLGASAPHFVYLPPGKNDLVFVDSLDAVRAMAAWPVWSTAPPSPPAPPLFDLREVTGKGRGMVACRAIRAGELIYAERPVYAQRADLARSADFDFTNGRAYVAPVHGLSQAARAAILGLTSAHGAARHALAGIFHTNNMELDVTPEPDARARFVGCFPTLARANHACAPSANYYFVFATFAGELRAGRDIAAGEEITISYCDVLRPRRERQESLQSLFAFRCHCETCEAPRADESDDRRARLANLVARIETPDASVPLSMLQEGLQWSTKERLWAKYAQVLFYGSACLMVRLDLVNGFEWARRARAEYLKLEGPQSATVKTINMLVPT